MRDRKRLGEILLKKKLITREELEECLQQQKVTREYLGAVLLAKNLISQEDLMKALAEQFHVPFMSLKKTYVDWQVCLRFSSVVNKDQKALPIRESELTVTVAISDPLDVMSVSKIEVMAWPKKIKLVLVTHEELQESLAEYKKRAKSHMKEFLNRG
jgi:hypothetical protein